MNKEKQKEIMYDSPEAATYVTNIEGWVDINRRFFGKGEEGERMARYSSHTHNICECGGKVEKGWTKCSECRRKSAIERYNAFPFKEWDGKEPVCTSSGEKYFFNEEELIDFMEENQMEEIDLMVCDPIYYSPICLDEIANDVHEEWEPEKELLNKINEFNSFLKTLPPHSWRVGKERTNYKK